MREHDANCLRVQMVHKFQAQHDLARHGLLEKSVEVGTEQLDGFRIIQLAQTGSDDEHVLDDLVLDAIVGPGARLIIRGRRE